MVTGGGLRTILSAAGRAALRSVFPLVFVLATGLLAAKNLDDIKLQATTFAVTVAIALFTALQAILPQFSWRYYIAETYAKYADAATQAFAGTFFSLTLGFLAAPDWSTWRSAIVGILVGALNALVRAVQAVFTPTEPVLDSTVEPKTEPRGAFASA